MNRHDRRVLDAIIRQDSESFLRACLQTVDPGRSFVPNWHIRAILYHLELVHRGVIKRLIINLPPRSLKSQIASVAFPAFLLGHDPGLRIMTASYAADLATKFASDFRSVVESEWYRSAFPKMKIKRAIETEVHTTVRGFRKAVSVYGAITGLGGDIFIIDDPQKPVDVQSEINREKLNNWYSNTLLSRLDNKETGAIVLVMQRVHMHDLTGHLLNELKGDWTVLSLPAIAQQDERILIGDGEYHFRRAGEALHPTYESPAALEKLREDMGPDTFLAQYQQSPVPADGKMLKSDWLRFYDRLPDSIKRPKVLQSWDTASKNGSHNDWSVCTTWHIYNGVYYLVDVVRGRFDYPTLRRTAIELAQLHKPHAIIIEDAVTGTALHDDLREVHLGSRVRLIPVEHDKRTRFYVSTAKFASGKVLLPRQAPWLQALVEELMTFPDSKHDDQVDSISQALNYKLSTYTLDNIS